MGNVKNIHIWHDSWIPLPSRYKVFSPPSLLQSDAWVEELIDTDTREWKMEIIHSIFLPYEADLIGGIALSSQLPDDKQVWVVTVNGRFNVRSAYKFALEFSSGSGVALASDNNNMRKFWEYLWSINIPHKVKHFAWRVCKEILPAKENLKRRKIIVDSRYDSCQAHEESSGHLFWGCYHAQEIWAISKLFPSNCAWLFPSFLDLLWVIVMIE